MELDREYIKEELKNLRQNKTLWWNALLLNIVGTIGIILKAIHSPDGNIIEIVLLILGFFLLFIIRHLMQTINKEIYKLMQEYQIRRK